VYLLYLLLYGASHKYIIPSPGSARFYSNNFHEQKAKA
jgi:hypothetical protein